MLYNSAVKISNLFFWIVIAMLLSSCSGKVNYGVLNNNAQIMFKESEALINQGKNEEGIKLIQLVKQIHKNDPRIIQAEKKVSQETLDFLKVDPLSGFNKKKLRAPVTPTRKERILWYFPDRVKDLVDMVTADLNVGYQLGAGVWSTRAIQAVAFVGATGGGGYYQKTLYGVKYEASSELVVGPVGGSLVSGIRAGLGGYAATANAVAFHTPDEPLYQDYRDYWALGGKIGLLVLGLEAELHPLEIVDFLGGLFLFDPLGDDFATSRSLDYTHTQESMIKSFTKMIQTAGKKGRAEYAEKYPTIFPKEI